VAVLVAIASTSLSASAELPDAIAVVVGRDSTIAEITLDDLREIYLRRRRQWPNGASPVPINLPVSDSTRVAFSMRILGRRPEQLLSYWDRQYYDGITPPVVLPSADAVCEYVRADRNAIGYMPASEASDACRILLILSP